MLLLILLLSLLTVSTAAGQELAVVHYGIREGLPSAYITCLAQGPDGRLWIGHSLGVSRYDGREFRTWTPEQGLLEVSPSSVLATDDGRIWVAFPQQGLQFIDRDGAVHTVPDPARILVRDHAAFLYRLGDDSVLLAGHKGYYRVAPDSVSGPIYPLADHSGYVTTILEGAAGQARLFATEDGVYRLREGRFERLPLPYGQMGSNHVSVMAFGPGGELWTLDGEGVLLRWNSEKDYTIWHIRQNERRLYPYRMLVDSEGTVWVASGQGLLRSVEGILRGCGALEFLHHRSADRSGRNLLDGDRERTGQDQLICLSQFPSREESARQLGLDDRRSPQRRYLARHQFRNRRRRPELAHPALDQRGRAPRREHSPHQSCS